MSNIVVSQLKDGEYRTLVEPGGSLAWMWPQYMTNTGYTDDAFDVCIALPLEEDEFDRHVRILVHVKNGDPVLRAEIRYNKLVITGIDRDFVEIESENIL